METSNSASGMIRSMANPDPPEEHLDVRGLGCASVLIELARLQRTHAKPLAVIVDTDDAGAPEELPAWCRLTGNTFVGRVSPSESASTHYRLVLEAPEESP